MIQNNEALEEMSSAKALTPDEFPQEGEGAPTVEVLPDADSDTSVPHKNKKPKKERKAKKSSDADGSDNKEKKPKKAKKDKKAKASKKQAKKEASAAAYGRKRIRIWSFSRRLLAMCLFPMILSCVLISTISKNAMKNIIEDEVETAMKVAAVSINETYSNLYDGDYSVDMSGAVRKGDTKISGNHDLVDAMSEKTGYDVSMLFSNRRLLTTLKGSNGSRANGLKIDQELYDQILEGNPIFMTDTIVDTECYVYYEPLVNSDGTVFGAVEITYGVENVQKEIQAQTTKITAYSVIIVVLAAIFTIFISSGTVKKMKQIKEFLDRIIEGKLDNSPNKSSLKANNELGDVYRSSVLLQGTIHDMVGGIKYSSDNLKVSADDLSEMAYDTTLSAEEVQEAIEKISEGARVQADNTNEARQSVLMINNQIEQIIEEVNIMAKNAGEMSLKEKESESIIAELAASCDDTKLSVSKAAEQINLMSESINDIKTAISLIQSIADETDLLSLNANIEAAKAGAAGRGFSVVADQICKLAVQSNESSQDIQRIIDNFLVITQRAVAVMEEVNRNMDIQQQKLILTKETYQAVSDGVSHSIDNMDNIKNKIDILNRSGMAISHAIDELSNVSELNADSAADTIMSVKDMNHTMQQVQSSSEELLNMAAELQKMLGGFEI